jgi:hypothetical protein
MSAGSTTNLGPRQGKSAHADTESDYTVACIAAVNEVMINRFGEEFSPIMFDNRRSAVAGARLKSAGIELAFAIAELRKACVLFNPSKHGCGKLPINLGYFEKGVLSAHAKRGQLGIPLLAVERATTRDRASSALRPEPISNLMQTVLDEIQNVPGEQSARRAGV